MLDMETLGVIQVAFRCRVPVFSLREITHNLAVQGNINLHTLLDYMWHYYKRAFLRKLLTHQCLLFKLFDFY